MWINLSLEELLAINLALEGTGRDTHQAISNRITADYSAHRNPENAKWIEKAKELHQEDGQVEVDDQADGTSVVSISDDGGAYVMAWVWVYDDQMPPECECQNCEWEGLLSRVKPITDYHERVAEGEPVPVGECPECGALCHGIEVNP